MIERLKKFDRRSALIALAVFLFVGIGNSSQIWLAIIAGVLAYIALRLFSPGSMMAGGGRGRETAQERQERSALAYESARTKVETIRTLATRIPKEGTRNLALRIVNESNRSLDLIESQNAKLAAPLLLEQLLEPAEGILDTYVRLGDRPGNAATNLLYQYEAQDLPMMERAARLFRDHLEKNGATDLKALEQTLVFSPEGTAAVTPIPVKK
jgi:hypothetical protein